MSWWEVIAVWKRLAFSPPLPWINCSNAAWKELRSWDWSKDEWARSHHTKTNATHPAAFPLLLSHWSVCFAFNVLVRTEGPLVIASAEESKHKKTCKRAITATPWDVRSWIWGGTFNQNHWITQSDCCGIGFLMLLSAECFLRWRFLPVRTKIFRQNVSFPCRWNVWICCHPNWWAQSGMQLRHSCH